MSWVYLDGDFLPIEKAHISVEDRGFLFGDGVFTTIRVNQGKLEFWQAHTERLRQHCQALNIEPPVLQMEWIEKLIQLNRAASGVWRLKILMTGGQSVSLGLPQRKINHLLITLKPYAMSPFSPCRLCLFPEPMHRPLAKIKTLAYLDRLWVYDYAQQRGYDDALVSTSGGEWLEVAFSNLFWSNGEEVWIPDPILPYLTGIFWEQLSAHLSMKVHFIERGLTQMPASMALYICNTLIHVRPVIEIEGRALARYPHLEKKLSQIIQKVCKLNTCE